MANGMVKYGVTAERDRAARSHVDDDDVACRRCSRQEVKEGAFDVWAPENVAPLVSFLASPAAREVTGQVFIVWGNQVSLLQGPRVEQRFETEGRWTAEGLAKEMATGLREDANRSPASCCRWADEWPTDLRDLIDPAHTAVVTQECQKGVLGDDVVFPQLAEIARAEMIPNGARLLKAARAAGVNVVHCIAARRPDGRGYNTNARLFGAARKSGIVLATGNRSYGRDRRVRARRTPTSSACACTGSARCGTPTSIRSCATST